MAKETKKDQGNEKKITDRMLSESIRRDTEKLGAIIGLYDALISQIQEEGIPENLDDMRILLFEAAISPVKDLQEVMNTLRNGKIVITEGK